MRRIFANDELKNRKLLKNISKDRCGQNYEVKICDLYAKKPNYLNLNLIEILILN